MSEQLKAYRDMLRRAEDRMETSRTDAEYEGNRQIADYASRQIDATLAKVNKW
jgi:hypothetical protein